MAWSAKPSGPYGFLSNEAKGNIAEMNSILTENGYTVEAISAVVGNAFGESGLNPWRWQNDRYSTSLGYGLFQFTPSSSYIDLAEAKASPYYGPNLSVTTQTSGAKPEDGAAQTYLVAEGNSGKWVSVGWRPYWDKTEYADEWKEWQEIVEKYGSNDRITQNQFKAIDDLRAATFVFLACFEGPGSLHVDTRYDYASTAYEIITGLPPKPPTPPTPAKRKGMPVWMMLRYF